MTAPLSPRKSGHPTSISFDRTSERVLQHSEVPVEIARIAMNPHPNELKVGPVRVDHVISVVEVVKLEDMLTRKPGISAPAYNNTNFLNYGRPRELFY
jgi:hypothetical protein